MEFQFDTQRGITAVISADNVDIGAQLREKSDILLRTLKLAGFEDINLRFDTNGSSSNSEKSFPEQTPNSDLFDVIETEAQPLSLNDLSTIST